MKKITPKTRVRISSSAIHNFLGLTFWDYNNKFEVTKYMYDNFNMKFTSKRIGLYYFSIGDKTRYSLFLLKHHDLIRDKYSW